MIVLMIEQTTKRTPRPRDYQSLGRYNNSKPVELLSVLFVTTCIETQIVAVLYYKN